MISGTDASIEFDPDSAAAVRIVLIGFMGAGKTSLARRWVATSAPAFWFDSDRAVLRALGCDTVTDAFQLVGEQRFRDVEHEVIAARAAALVRGVEVWSLGGGALEHPGVERLLADACIVWLDADPDVLWSRVAGIDRPLALDRSAFVELYHERRARYEQLATVRVSTEASLEELGLARVLADHLPPCWFGAALVVGSGVLDRIEDLAVDETSAVAIVADRAVTEVAAQAARRLRAAGVTVADELILPMGEFHKQLGTAEHITSSWAAAQLRRTDVVLAIGGGTLLDTVGFAASIYQRGVSWVSVPTTVTSQVDAGIGGKTAVNLGSVKNVLGSVHMPRATLIDTSVIDTLDDAAVRDGFVEAAKTAMLAGDWLLERATALVDAEPAARAGRWLELIDGCAGFKDAVVGEDPFDTESIRAQLNLGHTLAHAIEGATGGAVSHGAAVAIGTHAALRLSEELLDAPRELVDTWLDLCARMGVLTTSPIAWEELEPFLGLDKKRDGRGLGWTLLAGLGQPLTAVRVPMEQARSVWQSHVHVVPEGGSIAGEQRRRVLVLFGINLGELGAREAEHYGDVTLPQLIADVELWALAEGLVADCRQTDSLERFVRALHEARTSHAAVIINPGAWTHHELAIHDALVPLPVPRVEVHLSDVDSREEWRRVSVIRPAVDHVVSGSGAAGYRDALRWVREQLAVHDGDGAQ